jgi:hypothetical protein
VSWHPASIGQMLITDACMFAPFTRKMQAGMQRTDAASKKQMLKSGCLRTNALTGSPPVSLAKASLSLLEKKCKRSPKGRIGESNADFKIKYTNEYIIIPGLWIAYKWWETRSRGSSDGNRVKTIAGFQDRLYRVSPRRCCSRNCGCRVLQSTPLMGRRQPGIPHPPTWRSYPQYRCYMFRITRV